MRVRSAKGLVEKRIFFASHSTQDEISDGRRLIRQTRVPPKCCCYQDDSQQIQYPRMPVEVKENQCQVVMVGCGAPNRGMGWYHAVQMLEGRVPSAALCYVVEPWFLGPGECQRFVHGATK